MNTYSILGRTWNLEKKFYHWDRERRFYYFDVDEEKEFTCEANSLMEAWKWMLENHPNYAIGCNIRCKNNSDFFLDAVLSYYTEKLNTMDINSIVAKNLEICKSQI